MTLEAGGGARELTQGLGHAQIPLAARPAAPAALSLACPLPPIHPRDVQLAVQKYEDLFPAFSDSREYKLMKVSAGACPPPSPGRRRRVAGTRGGARGLALVTAIAKACV